MRYGTCPECGAALRPGTAPFTRECASEECGAVWSVDTDSDTGAITFDEMLALLGLDELELREEIGNGTKRE